jgi:hypothetical protein
VSDKSGVFRIPQSVLTERRCKRFDQLESAGVDIRTIVKMLAKEFPGT